MSWETRGNKQYFYRRRKVNGRVVGQYLGKGYAAELMHLLTEYERQERQEKRQREQAKPAAKPLPVPP